MPEAGLIAGFDAGQTHTRCRLADAASGAVLAEGSGPGVSHLAAATGVERFQQALRISLAQARSQLNTPEASEEQQQGPACPLLAAAIGASGIEVGSPVQERAAQLAATALELPLARLLVTGDERTALRGARGDQAEGILVISGTGMIAVGRNAAGLEHRCGGWGWLLDGAGSAMDIGRDGLALTLEMADGRLAESPLRSRLWAALKLDPEDPQAAQTIKALVVNPGFGAAGFAALAPAVAAAAAAGDRDAAAVLERSAAALARMVITISSELQLAAPAVWPLGGALQHLPLLRSGLASQLERHCPGARLLEPAGDGCSGALALARECLQSSAATP